MSNPSYPEEMVAPMRREVVALGLKELKSAAEVDQALAPGKGTALVFVNSVCGCAAGSARPGLAISFQRTKVRPDRMYTVFAGMEKDAVEAVRRRLIGYPPSSPFVALFKDGDLIAAVERHQIQMIDAESLGGLVAGLLEQHCAAGASATRA